MKNKEKTLRISLFFDAVTNINEDIKDNLKCINSAVAIPDHDLMQSNIYRLFCNLTKKTDTYHKAAYIGGGNSTKATQNKKSIAVSDSDKYKADSKTRIASKNLLDILKGFCLNHQNIALSLKIDLFGVGNGAALARNFANFLHSNQDIKKEISAALAKNENVLGEITFGFVGLFNTKETDLGNLKNININLNNIKADAIFHLTAMHEICENSPRLSVTNTKHYATSGDLDDFGSSSNRITNTFEFAVPGSHTDIVGGCNLFEDEDCIINSKPTYNATCLTENIHSIIDSNLLLAPLFSSIEFEFNIFRGGYTAINRRKNVYGHLQLVYAQLMVDTAAKFGVPFDVLQFEITHKVPSELSYFYSTLIDSRNLLLNVKKFSSPINALAPQLVQKYVHLSSSVRRSVDKSKKNSKISLLIESSESRNVLSQIKNAVAECNRKIFTNNSKRHLEPARRYYWLLF